MNPDTTAADVLRVIDALLERPDVLNDLLRRWSRLDDAADLGGEGG